MNISIRYLKGQYGSDHIVPDTISWINFWTPRKNELSVEICIRSLEGQYGSNRNVPDTVF